MCHRRSRRLAVIDSEAVREEASCDARSAGRMRTGKDDLEAEYDAKDVGHVGQRLEEGAHDDPHPWIARDQADRPEDPQDA